MLQFILTIIWLFLPAGIANSTPPMLALIVKEKWDYPIDFGLTFRGKRVFGAHKTIRGLIAGTIVGGLIFLFQRCLQSNGLEGQYLDEFRYLPISYGFAMGFGALAGDAIKSFFKRQINVAPGKSWFPFDQLDWIFGGLVIQAFYFPVSNIVFPAIILGLIVHLLSKYIGYLLKLNEDPI